MIYTDSASESSSLKKNPDTSPTSKNLVSEAYDPSAKSFSATSDATKRGQATLPNGQLDFGSFAGLYGAESHTDAKQMRESSDTPAGQQSESSTQTEKFMADLIQHIQQMAQGIGDNTGSTNAKPNPNWRQLRESLEEQLKNSNGNGSGENTSDGQDINGSSGSQKSDSRNAGGGAQGSDTTNGNSNNKNNVGGKSSGQPQNDTSITSDINASGVDQASVGDCFFDSALASLANSKQGQQTIRDMIKTNSDGSYTVTFPGDKSSPVTVTQKDLAENQKNGQVEDSATWARVVETAFLKYDHAEQYGSGLNGLQKEGIPNLGNVAYADKALQLLTGKSASTDSMGVLNIDNREITLGNTSKANIASDMQTALKNGEPITAASSSGFETDIGEHGSGPMEGDHVYSVMSYDAKTGTVVVRNPWGSNVDTALQKVGTTKDGITSMPDGELSMSMDTFTKYFTAMNFAGQNPYLHDAENIGKDTWTTLKDGGKGFKDLFTGNFGALPGDAEKYFKDDLQSFSDTVYGVTDAGERAVKSVVSKAWDGATGLVKGAAHVGGHIVHDLNPLNW